MLIIYALNNHLLRLLNQSPYNLGEIIKKIM